LDVSNEGLTARQPTEGYACRHRHLHPHHRHHHHDRLFHRVRGLRVDRWTTTSTLQPLKPGRINYFEITFTVYLCHFFL
jgi:hypothetical protein